MGERAPRGGAGSSSGTRRVTGGRSGRAALLALALLAAAACGSDGPDDAVSTGRGQEPGAADTTGDAVPDIGVPTSWGTDLSTVFEGRLPTITGGPAGFVAVSAADPSAGLDRSIVAVGTGEGDLREVDIGVVLVTASAVVVEGAAIVVGNECGSPVEGDGGCEPSALTPRAFEVDLATARSTEAPGPPADHLANKGVGSGVDGPVFLSQRSNGTFATLTRVGSEWRSRPLPFAADSMCAIGPHLVAVTPATESALDGGVVSADKIPAGRPIWRAYVSEDGGTTWSEPIEHRSLVEDVGFSAFTVCGPDQVLVHTLQLAWFDPETRRWVAEAGSVGTGAGAAIAHQGDGSTALWTTPTPPPEPAEDGGPGEPVSEERLWWPDPVGETPRATRAPADLPDGVTLVTAGGPGAAASGYVIASRSTATGYDIIRLS